MEPSNRQTNLGAGREVNLLRDSGSEPNLAPRIVFSTHAGGREEPYVVPNRLWRLDLVDALARVVLPSHLYWSGPPLEYDLSNRRDRARVYEIVLREGVPNDLMKYIDGAFLIDLWDDLVLPRVLRAAWEPLIRHCRGEGVYAGRPSS